MGRGICGLFRNTIGEKKQITLVLIKPCNIDKNKNVEDSNKQENKDKIDYNSAESKSVAIVNKVTEVNDMHSLPTNNEPNSVIINYKNGNIYSERYFNDKGDAYLDIDYSNHGNSKMHPYVPHEHSIEIKNGKMFRDSKGRKIKK